MGRHSRSLSVDVLIEQQKKLTVEAPAYDRKQLTAGIIHIGVGNFHRAHQAAYLDDLMGLADSYSNEWAILGAGVMPFDAAKREALEKQDWISTVVERQADYVSARLIGSMIGFIPVEPPNHEPLRQALLEPNIKIVSLTVTEGGYYLNSATGKFDPKNPQILEDAANPDAPKTIFGLIVQALKKRRDAGLDPLTIMSCDNIPHNGNVAKGTVLGLAKMIDEDLATWISKNAGFPNSMVDRITPMTGDKERQFIKDELEYEDAWPVFCEPFKQWVLEDDFVSGRPALERVGVQFVPDVGPYELMKIRILNGAHASLCYAAALLELTHVHDAMDHNIISTFLDSVQCNEVIPSVPPVPDTDLYDYWELIKARFGNPMILDTIDRICFDGANRQPKFIIPPVADNLRDGRPIDGLALVSAMWCRYCQGTAESGREFEPNDPIWDELHETAIKAADDPTVWLNMRGIYGDVGQNRKFVKSFSAALNKIMDDGVEMAMLNYINKRRPGSISEEQMEPISEDIFQEIQDKLTLGTPAYDRKQLKAGIVHIGVGNFHRAHQAAYLDDLLGLADSYSNEWAILGAGVTSFDAKKRAVLEGQDWLTTLVERQADYVSARLIGSMIGFIPVELPNHEPLKQALLDPDIKIVSLTVTEGGYYLNSATGKFDPTNPQILEDAANPDAPKTAFGIIVQALKKRRDAGLLPFTVMSCDNIPHNGNVVKGVVLGLAKMIDEDLASWISKNVGFPNSMVDRITPMTSDKERQFIKDKLGYEDAHPVFCEPFKQWVLEDDFPSGRPALELVGVHFVPDVGPYELMKIRILNGAHASLCYAAALLELTHVHDAMNHEVISAFLNCVQRKEVIPSVPPVPDTDLFDYWELVQARFENPMILDTIDRICFDGANRQPKFIIPPVADNLRDGRPIDGLALVSAMWCRYCQGKAESGKKFEPNDPIWDQLHGTALKAANDPTVWLNMSGIYGSVGKNRRFIDAFSSALRTISEAGVQKAMKDYIEKNEG